MQNKLFMVTNIKKRAITTTETARTKLIKMSGSLPNIHPEKPAIIRRPDPNQNIAPTTEALSEAPQPAARQNSDELTADHQSWVQNKKPRLLIIDDQPMVGRSIADGLAYFGYDSLSTHLPVEAIAYLKAYPFDLLLIDCAMPEMNGLELVTHIREAGFAMPIILMSGQWKKIDPIESERLGIALFIEKPFTLRLLDEIVLLVAKRQVVVP